MTQPASGAAQVSVLVATRERSAGCRRLCTAIEKQVTAEGLRAEIILIFDGCAAYDWYEASDLYRAVLLDRQRGIAQARNAGIEASTGEVLVFLDDDAIPAKSWFSGLMSALDTYPDMVAFGGRVIGSDHANLYGQLRDQVYYRETFGAWYVDPRDSGDIVGPPYVNGGNGAYRRSSIVEAGGFTPILPAYSDVELGRRLNLAARGVLVAEMSILHDHPSTFHPYMLRCYRSGLARGVLWTAFRYQRDSPLRVGSAIVRNILWQNIVRRSARINAPRLYTIGVLLCQEVIHGVGYARALLAAH